MNAPDSFEKQIDVAVSYNGYYPAPYSPSTTASSSCYSTPSSSNKKSLTKEETVEIVRKLYPLTMENVSKVELADPSSMPLARYCSEMGTPEAIYAPFTPSARKMLRRPQEVLESPRVLPFPYHNDSYFLPTAEHDYPGGLTATDASSSIVSLSVHTMGSRQHLSSNSTSTSLYHPHHQQRGYQRQLLSCPPKSHFYSQKRYDDDNMSNYSNKRRAVSVTPSSPSTLREETLVAPKKRRGHNKFAFKFKQNLLRFKSNNSTILETTHHCNRLQHPLSSSASIISNTLILTNDTTTTKVKQQRYESLQYNTAPVNNGPWYEKLWKLIKPTTLVKKNSKSPKTVWYSQFRCNPPPPVDINLLS
ncbi:hypothetical protein INT47_008035 [Mucor saturninus]|uniref:Uncharacterized protein n=1 Tax=Mucor saturninus TaxID=64648 RepID=A0A8H7R9G7_9FUNG|nr:hypothetical protein INT47_008035 [Mucor saturninus]